MCGCLLWAPGKRDSERLRSTSACTYSLCRSQLDWFILHCSKSHRDGEPPAGSLRCNWGCSFRTDILKRNPRARQPGPGEEPSCVLGSEGGCASLPLPRVFTEVSTEVINSPGGQNIAEVSKSKQVHGCWGEWFLNKGCRAAQAVLSLVFHVIVNLGAWCLSVST